MARLEFFSPCAALQLQRFAGSPRLSTSPSATIVREYHHQAADNTPTIHAAQCRDSPPHMIHGVQWTLDIRDALRLATHRRQSCLYLLETCVIVAESLNIANSRSSWCTNLDPSKPAVQSPVGLYTEKAPKSFQCLHRTGFEFGLGSVLRGWHFFS